MPVNCLIFGKISVPHPELVNVYGGDSTSISDGTKIGAFVEIQGDVVIGRRCKISSHSFICEGTRIEDEVFIGHGVLLANDKFPKATNKDGTLKEKKDWEKLGIIIEKGASIGNGAVICPGLILGANCLIGAGSVVTKNVPPNEVWVGNPARKLR